MRVPKQLAVIGFSGLSGATEVGLNYVKGTMIPHENIVFLFYGRTPGINPSYQEEMERLGVQTAFVSKKPGWIDWGSQYAVFKSLQKLLPKNIMLVSSAPFLGVLAYKILHPKTNVLCIEQHPLNLTSVKEYVHSYTALTFFDYIIPASESYAKGYITSRRPFSNIFKRKIVVIPNGLEIPSKTGVVKEELGQVVVIGMAARFDDVKDYDTVIRALHKLNSEGSVRYIFKIAGDGPNRARTEKLVKDLILEDDVIFLGLINKPEMEKFYESLDIYVQSTHGEAMSLSMMEAMGHGKVFLGTNVRGLEEFIINGENGYQFQCGDYEDLAEKIKFVQKNPLIAKKLSQGARAYYERHFSLPSMVREYSRLMTGGFDDGPSQSFS